MHPAEIKAELAKIGLTLEALNRQMNLPARCCSHALRRPCWMGEVAIAAALGRRGNELWPERYDGGRYKHLSSQRYAEDYTDKLNLCSQLRRNNGDQHGGAL